MRTFRRARAVLVTAVAATVVGLAATPAASAPATSQNGHPVAPKSAMTSWKVGGTTFYTQPGPATAYLKDFVTWFDKNIEPVSATATGQPDDWSWAPARNVRGSSRHVSNHASGTAVDLNATLHELGDTGTFTPAQARLIRQKLTGYRGALRWGGDYTVGPVDEMHFEYVAAPARRGTR